MITFRTKLLFFIALIVTLVLVIWLYTQQTYSAFNLAQPGVTDIQAEQELETQTIMVSVTPDPAQPSTFAPTPAGTTSENAGCTLPLEYWLQNKTRIPPQVLINVSGVNHAEVCVNYAQSEICANLDEVSESAEVNLRQQFLVAIMNYLVGADSGVIGNAINDAYAWLRTHASTSPIPEQDLRVAQLFADKLRSYNEGEIGPGACEEDVFPVIDIETLPVTPSATMGNTAVGASPTQTNTPTATVRRTAVVVIPTSTDTPGEEPEPTQPPPPPPTNTEPAPTETLPPPPTPTLPPPPTNTDIPTPTPVPEIETPTPVP